MHGEEGAELVRAQPWDLVVADIELPGMSGLELVGEIKAAQSDVAVLIISARASLRLRGRRALRAGADDYMTKPVDPVALVEKAASSSRSRATGAPAAARSSWPSARIPTTSRSASAASSCATPPRATR